MILVLVLAPLGPLKACYGILRLNLYGKKMFAGKDAVDVFKKNSRIW